jgi:cell division protein FtsB
MITKRNPKETRPACRSRAKIGAIYLRNGAGGWQSWGVSSRRIVIERALPLAILALAVVSVPVMIFSPSGLRRLDGLREERARADVEISRLSQDIRELRAEVQRIKSDPAAVERVARDELGLVRQTEVVFQFKD